MFRSLTASILVYVMAFFGLQPVASAQFAPAYNSSTTSGVYSDHGAYWEPQGYPPPAPAAQQYSQSAPYPQGSPYPQAPGAYAPAQQQYPQYGAPGQYPQTGAYPP